MGSTSPRNVCGRRWRWPVRGLSSRSICTSGCGMWYRPTGKEKRYEVKKNRKNSHRREARGRPRGTPFPSKEFCDTLYLKTHAKYVEAKSIDRCIIYANLLT